ncbi:UDP-N-acetylmuramate:L-alanyl-gamma-D-glutamyl-meso-diaminopimelate ligase [Pseudidiomarina salinarum]|uniref:UDP-N-acetylmuramate--L-alanyl-gamma-D-glutamyl-meso-2,6-diaminoheptandioate ligase n=1 Tax=Pseudidiomarina salinarum TaxID=435908 RepID=A0A094ITA2_9GAMM|nr:UDP-N-acetylmuramate:L-alanyl-gamma-D-glutamyl-meso-diaminopimelate ligase [Pseudidiomarina salinarum]KFZ30342.1 UDP-N-acetylmuramate:L-alanyl-gamma-D-glutamyl-meso-diaminopimelate ligase [Pseudidiomarina salinarum]RUO68494.1 UDP-N-acetylmuramate:L-alanyl-gamma-D-glutamyl-meso-diaminopimelate ligase [Pseudidiomarina salinarum]
MHIHILGICGTFMGGIAALAKALGHQVTGSDAQVYPPMSDQLRALGIDLIEGYDAAQLEPRPDLVIIGNAMSRGNPAVEAVLNKRIPYCSGAQWLHDAVLQHKWVLAVAGTHGKTTTSSMLTWLLDYAGLKPGFLVGGVLANFAASARLGESDFFVIEADEYDTAFFDKRSKFVHYCPSTLIINNLEFDHADIFSDLAAIQRQFHHLVRVVPGYGRVLYPPADAAVTEVLQQGCWSEQMAVGTNGEWQAELAQPDGSVFRVLHQGQLVGEVSWSLIGQHNVDNALMAIAAAHHVGVSGAVSCAALGEFKNTRRRLELRGEARGIRVYDDFAHHPTAIDTTLKGLRAKVGDARIIAVLEPRSNTMKLGVHAQQLQASLSAADQIIMLKPPGLQWSVAEVVPRAQTDDTVEQILQRLGELVQPGDHILIMSNGGFANIHQRLLTQLQG